MTGRSKQREIWMSVYDARLGTRINGAVARRLRLLVLVRRQPLNRVLTDLLDQTLPSLTELTEQLKGQGSDDN
jgi:hypothetical protein